MQAFVKAPNGKSYRFHAATVGGSKGYVYALGHRVYGTRGTSDAITGDVPFTPTATGKWAFCVAAVEALEGRAVTVSI